MRNNSKVFTPEEAYSWAQDGMDYLDSSKVRALSVEDFFKKRIRIKDLHNQIVKLAPNPLQLMHEQRKMKAIQDGKENKFILLKYRRGGVTTWEQALSYRACATLRNVTCATLAQTRTDTEVIFRMVKLMLRLDPNSGTKVGESMSHIEFKNNNSIFHVGTAGAKSFSRGDNIHRAHGSEVAFWEGKIEVIDNLLAGVTEAARHGQVVLESTANGASGWFYEKYKEAMEGGNDWNPLFYPWFIDPQNTIEVFTPEQQEEFISNMTDEEQHCMEKHSLRFGQMMWRRKKQFSLKKLFPQEYPETWEEAFLVRGLTFFDLDTLSKISKQVKPPIVTKQDTTIWEQPISGDEYSAGADCSEGHVGGDMSVMGILHKKTGKQVAVLRGRWRPEVFARKCVDLCKHYNNALYACEINNHGHSVMNTVMNECNYKHLYYRLRNIDKDKYGAGKKERVPGWATTAKTRPILLDELNQALEEGHMLVNDTVFIAEAKTFVDDGGKYEADTGQHDDSVIAWGVAWQCRKQKKKSYISV